SEYYLLAGNISRCQARLAFIVCVLIVLKGRLTGSARRSIRPAGLIEEAQENGTGRWHLRAEHEKQSLAGDVLRTEDHFTLVAFRIAAWSFSAVTASGKTVMVSG
ncbi:hypothetical protein, partial [Enterobacter hormaechei]|uniref:hypothetical protein n=2 Tax=Enterobacteriaceae TaxID=543 RepID=UPI002E2C805F